MSAASELVEEVVRDVLRAAWARGDTPGGQAATFREARELGWHLLGVDEGRGGVGGDLGDRLRLAELLGEHGCDGPYLEVNTAAVHLADPAEAEPAGVDPAAATAGEVAVIAADDYGAPNGRAYLDACGDVTRVTVAGREHLHGATPSPPMTVSTAGTALLPVTYTTGASVAGTQRAAEVRADLDLLRCARLAGAARTVARLSARHAIEREQFGRPLIRFQAVGALVAEQRAAAELAEAAVHGAATATPRQRQPLLDGAVSVCHETAGTVARLAHQTHGAMGTTHEHPLHRLTRRLWGWRDQLGADHARATRLGAWAASVDEPALWECLRPERDEPR